jgi:hypothetical protein
MYNNITTYFYEKDNLEISKENGIYITPYTRIKKCFENEDINKYKDIGNKYFSDFNWKVLDTLKLYSNNEMRSRCIEWKEKHKK